MNDDGYQILEVRELGDWLGSIKHQQLLIMALNWLSNLLMERLVKNYPDILIEPIKVEFCGAYPSIGIQYLNKDTPDLSEIIESEITTILNTESAIVFFKYAFSKEVNWNDISNNLML